MQRRSLAKINSQKVLALPILDRHGNTLYPAGYILKPAEVDEALKITKAAFFAPPGFEDMVGDEDAVLMMKKIFFHIGETESLYEAIRSGDSEKAAKLLRKISNILISDISAGMITMDLLFPKPEGTYLSSHALFATILLLSILFLQSRQKAEIKGSSHFSKDDFVESLGGKEILEEIVLGSLLMEIGMLTIPPEILEKDVLSEWEKAKFVFPHPVKGLEMIEKVLPVGTVARTILLDNHESPNGRGYPRHITEIDPVTSLVKCCSIFDALVSDRPYRKEKGGSRDDRAYTAYEAFEFLKRDVDAGSVSMRSFRLLEKFVPPFPVGTTVLLSNDGTGVVVDCSDERWSRPVVRITGSMSQKREYSIYDMDLLENTEVYIKKALYT